MTTKFNLQSIEFYLPVRHDAAPEHRRAVLVSHRRAVPDLRPILCD